MENSSFTSARKISLLHLFLGVLVVVAVGAVLREAQSVVIPLLLAWLLSYLLYPVVAFFRKKCRIPNVLSVAAVVILLLLLCWGVGLVVQQRLLVFAKAYPAYHSRLTAIMTEYGTELSIPAAVLNEMDLTGQLTPLLVKSSRFFVSFFSNVVLVLIFLVFMLLARPYSRTKIREAFPDHADRFISITDAISRQISAYLGALFMISLVTGLTVWAVLALVFHDEFALTWGLLAFVLNFIPTVGSIVASIPPILLAIVNHYPAWWPAIATALSLLVIQMTLGNLIAPKIYGDRLNLSPVVILLFLCFWGWLWGISGALLSVPLAAAIQITCRHIPVLEPIAILMGSGKKYLQHNKATSHADGNAARPIPSPKS